MRLKPIGTISFDASPSADVVSYRVYFADNAEALTPDTLDYDNGEYHEVPVVDGQTTYTVSLDNLDLTVDRVLYFAVVSVDDVGNLSDPGNVIDVAVDGEAPLPPTNLRYTPSA